MFADTTASHRVDLKDSPPITAPPASALDRPLDHGRAPACGVTAANATPAAAAPDQGAPFAGGVLNPLTSLAWDELVEQWSTATVFHTSAWMAVLADSYGFKPFALVHPVPGERPAMLPMMECASPLFGRRGVALPFTDAAPPLAHTAEQAQSLFAQAQELAQTRNWRTLELRGVSDFAGASPSMTFLGHTLTLEGTGDALWTRLDESVRRALRKAARSGLDVCRETSWESLAGYYRLHCQTRRLHGLPPQPLYFFRHLHRRLIARGAGSIFTARHQGQVVAAAVFLHRGRRVVYKFGASDRKRQDLRANNAVMWEAIRFYAAAGMESLDFGRTACQQAGLRRYKLGWGTCETSLAYWKYDLRRRRFVADADRSRGWHTVVFRRLPLPVLRWLGACLYPHLT